MAKKMLISFIGAFLFAFLVSCTKLPESQAPLPITLAKFGMETLKLDDTIPLKWGNLISVSNVNPVWVRMFFQDKEGNVYLVWYNINENKFQEEYRVLKRR
jgi:hypothetical protein